jgi:hypothetical protein
VTDGPFAETKEQLAGFYMIEAKDLNEAIQIAARIPPARVGSAKYVARLRTQKTDQNPLILKTNMAAGHGGASGRYDALREAAFDYAFILTQMGLDR